MQYATTNAITFASSPATANAQLPTAAIFLRICYIKSMTIVFLQLNRNNVIGSEILFLLMLKFQRKKLSLPVKENFLELRNDRTLRLKFRDITLDEF